MACRGERLSMHDFNPRPPWGGRQRPARCQMPKRSAISIHALRGEGDDQRPARSACRDISIHALRGEGDGEAIQKTADDKIFQSTPSVGRATIKLFAVAPLVAISIHALRGEGDVTVPSKSSAPRSISIHALRGEGDTPQFVADKINNGISIHALRGEGDF